MQHVLKRQKTPPQPFMQFQSSNMNFRPICYAQASSISFPTSPIGRFDIGQPHFSIQILLV